MMPARRDLPVAAALLALASLALFWPGYAMYDTVAQYRQVVSGIYDDWHPPAMARLWSLAGVAGAAPMLALQLAGYWAGFGLIATRAGARVGAAVLAIGALPLFLGWQAVVLKDAQMAAALLAATGVVAWWRLAGRPLPGVAVAGVALLVGYATLVRANAVFASVPLVVMLLPRPAGIGKAAAVGAGVLAVLAAASPINHRVFAALPSGVERTQALYDLADIAVRAGPDATGTGLLPAETAELIAKGCVRPYFWDPLGEPSRCDATVERLRHVPVGTLYATLAGAILRHPLAYAAHRLAHLNSTERWLVPWRWPGAAPPRISEANRLGLGSPGRLAAAWQVLAGWVAETPVGWPIMWVTVAIAALAAGSGRPATPARDLARALLVSALCLEASFAVLSLASDLRYHLWPMIAAALALTLLLGEAAPRRRTAIGGGLALALALVAGAGAVARATLPLPPQTYAGMLG